MSISIHKAKGCAAKSSTLQSVERVQLSWTFSFNYDITVLGGERYWNAEKTVRGIFEIVDAGYVTLGEVFADDTHIKANANTTRVVQKEIPVAAKRYAEKLV